MKTYIIIAFLFCSSYTQAYASDGPIPVKTSKSVLFPTHRISIITKEGYRLNGLLMTSNDSQLIIFPGKYKEWKVNKKYPIVRYPYSKIQTVRLFNVRRGANHLSQKSSKKLVYINGSKNQFRLFRHSVS